MHRAILYLLCLLALLLSTCGLQNSEADAATLKIAVIAPQSGDFSALGQSSRNGVLLAVEAWNQRGGVLGQNVQIVLKDSQCDYQAGRAAASDAIDEGASFIIGAVCALASEGVAQVAMERTALQVTHASVNLDLTLNIDGDVRPLVFRVPFVDPVQGHAAAAFALEDLDAATAAVLYAEGSAYGSALSEAFEAMFKEEDGKIVARETYAQDAEAFFEVLEPIRDAQPDVIYAPGYYNVMNRLVPQARAFGLLQPILGSDGWHAPELRLENLNRCYFTSHFYAQEPRAVVETWVQMYEARFLVAPDALATMAYDAANMLLTAIQEAGTTNPYEVADVMAVATFDAVSGEITFDLAHNPVKPVLLLKVQDGDLLFVGRRVVAED